MKPLSVEKVWYNKDVEIRGCNWSMVKSQKPRANNATNACVDCLNNATSQRLITKKI